MKKFLINITFVAIILLITFFGLGPVLFADGSFGERMITLFVVVLLYIAAIMIYLKIKTKFYSR